MSTESRNRRIRLLYADMPGAPMPDHYYAWGEVEGNDHWRFCPAIVDLIDEATAKARGESAA